MSIRIAGAVRCAAFLTKGRQGKGASQSRIPESSPRVAQWPHLPLCEPFASLSDIHEKFEPGRWHGKCNSPRGRRGPCPTDLVLCFAIMATYSGMRMGQISAFETGLPYASKTGNSSWGSHLFHAPDHDSYRYHLEMRHRIHGIVYLAINAISFELEVA